MHVGNYQAKIIIGTECQRWYQSIRKGSITLIIGLLERSTVFMWVLTGTCSRDTWCCYGCWRRWWPRRCSLSWPGPRRRLWTSPGAYARFRRVWFWYTLLFPGSTFNYYLTAYAFDYIRKHKQQRTGYPLRLMSLNMGLFKDCLMR